MECAGKRPIVFFWRNFCLYCLLWLCFGFDSGRLELLWVFGFVLSKFEVFWFFFSMIFVPLFHLLTSYRPWNLSLHFQVYFRDRDQNLKATASNRSLPSIWIVNFSVNLWWYYPFLINLKQLVILYLYNSQHSITKSDTDFQLFIIHKWIYLDLHSLKSLKYFN